MGTISKCPDVSGGRTSKKEFEDPGRDKLDYSKRQTARILLNPGKNERRQVIWKNKQFRQMDLDIQVASAQEKNGM